MKQVIIPESVVREIVPNLPAKLPKTYTRMLDKKKKQFTIESRTDGNYKLTIY